MNKNLRIPDGSKEQEKIIEAIKSLVQSFNNNVTEDVYDGTYYLIRAYMGSDSATVFANGLRTNFNGNPYNQVIYYTGNWIGLWEEIYNSRD